MRDLRADSLVSPAKSRWKDLRGRGDGAEHRKRRGNQYCRQNQQTCQYRHVKNLSTDKRGIPFLAEESPESRRGASA